ncbi:MAG: UvrD-helicase domain-containing protein [Leptospiraceae bacterium]|nr:UvrD-helicase domain-containing protein [Leptospiraceae bacterium]
MQSSVDYSGAQQRVIFEEYPIKQVVAAAGSGKTRTVIGLVEHRLAVGLEQPGSILLISFSRRAAGELRMRMRADLRSAVEIRTFHSFCYHKLRSYAPEFRDNPPRIIEDRERRAVLRALMRADPEAESIGGIPYSILIQQLVEFELHFPGMFRRVQAAYARYKREKNALEYADLITLMLDALRDDSIEWAARLRRRYSLILVDEFQDTDPPTAGVSEADESGPHCNRRRRASEYLWISRRNSRPVLKLSERISRRAYL